MFITACSSQVATHGPEGPRPNAKTWETPKDVPIIDLSQDNVPYFWTATPTIINTNDFTDKHQINGPLSGAHPRPAKFLPPHKKPRFDEEGNVSAQHIMAVNWSGDHRIIDGATMVRFNNLWMSYLTQPEKMLMHLR